MNIYKNAMISMKGRLHDVSILLWEDDIQHLTFCEEQDGKLSHHEIEVFDDTLDKLLKNDIIDLHEYNELYQAKVDFIILI
jgi:hypothetical protein